MRNRGIVWTCTLLGLVGGILFACFSNYKSGITWGVWWYELFVRPEWFSWVQAVAMLVVPALVGLCIGLRSERPVMTTILTPILCALAAFAAMIVVTIAWLIMENFMVVSFIGFVLIIGLLMPVTYTIIVVIFKG